MALLQLGARREKAASSLWWQGKLRLVVDGMARTPGFVPRSVTRIAVTIIYLGVPLPTPSSGPPDYIERTTQ